jgi:hypothetical protein
LVGWLARLITSALKMETALFSETLVLQTNPHGDNPKEHHKDHQKPVMVVSITKITII